MKQLLGLLHNPNSVALNIIKLNEECFCNLCAPLPGC